MTCSGIDVIHFGTAKFFPQKVFSAHSTTTKEMSWSKNKASSKECFWNEWCKCKTIQRSTPHLHQEAASSLHTSFSSHHSSPSHFSALFILLSSASSFQPHHQPLLSFSFSTFSSTIYFLFRYTLYAYTILCY